MGIFFFVLSNAFLLAASFCLAFRFFRKRPVELAVLAAIVLFPVLILLVVLGLGTFGFLDRIAVTCVVSIIGIAITGFQLLANRRALGHWRFILVIGLLLVLFGVACGYFTGRFVIKGTSLISDDLSYHGPAVAHWIKTGSLWAGPYNYHYYYPYNAEVISLWWILPFHADGLGFLSGLYWLGVVIVAVFILAGRLGLPLWCRLLAPIGLLASNVVLNQVHHTLAAVDLCASAMVLACIAFLSYRRGEPGVKTSSTEIVFAGLACGFAIGCKVPFAVPGFVIFLWILLSDRKSLSWTCRLREAFLFAFFAFITGSYWYMRNIYLTGNPLFPGQLGPLAGPLTSQIRFQTTIGGQLIKHHFSREVIVYSIGRITSWPGSLFVLSACGYAAGAIRCLGKSQSTERKLVVLLLLIGVVMLCTFVVAPFSGSNNSPDAPTVIKLRFVITPFIVGIILFALLLNANHYLKWLWRFMFAAAVIWSFGKTHSHLSLLVGTVLLLLTLFNAKVRYFTPRGAKLLPVSACLLFGGLAGLGACYSYQQSLTDQRLFELFGDSSSAESPWEFLERLPQGARVSIASSGYKYYPLFGRRLQFEPTPLDTNGVSYRRLHERYRETPQEVQWWPKPKDTPSFEDRIENAKRNGAEYMLIFRRKNGEWPCDAEILNRCMSNEFGETKSFKLLQF